MKKINKKSLQYVSMTKVTHSLNAIKLATTYMNTKYSAKLRTHIEFFMFLTH